MMTLDRKEIHKYFSDLCTTFMTYHNHKETSAWAAVALYPIIILQYYDVLNSYLKIYITTTCAKTIVIILFLLFTFGVLYYVHIQYKLRKISAYVIAACRKLSLKYLTADEADIKLSDFEHCPHRTVLNHKDIGKILPLCLIDTIDEQSNYCKEYITILEYCGYCIILLTAFVFILLIL